MSSFNSMSQHLSTIQRSIFLRVHHSAFEWSLQNSIVFHIPKAQVLSIQDPANHEYAPDLFPWYVEFWAPNTALLDWLACA